MRIVNFRYGIASEDFVGLCKEFSSNVDKEVEKYRAIAVKSDPGYVWGLLQGVLGNATEYLASVIFHMLGNAGISQFDDPQCEPRVVALSREDGFYVVNVSTPYEERDLCGDTTLVASLMLAMWVAQESGRYNVLRVIPRLPEMCVSRHIQSKGDFYRWYPDGDGFDIKFGGVESQFSLGNARPIVLCDFDGTLNAFGWFEKTPKVRKDWYHGITTSTVEVGQNIDVTVKTLDTPMKVFSDLITRQEIEFSWCSSWRTEGDDAKLADLVGIPYSMFGRMGLFSVHGFDKVATVREVLRRHANRGVLWLDDFGYMVDKLNDWWDSEEGELVMSSRTALFVESVPDSDSGITKPQMREIRHWVDVMSANRLMTA